MSDTFEITEGKPWGWWVKDKTIDSAGFMIFNPERLVIASPPDEWIITPLYTKPCDNDLVKAIKREHKAKELYDNTPSDRGGPNGNKGKAYQYWMETRDHIQRLINS